MCESTLAFKGKSGQKDVFVDSSNLHFTIRYFTSYEAYDWNKFYRTEDYGEIGTGIIRGDRYSIIPPQNCWVYLFKKADSKITLHSTFKFEDELYTPLTVTESDLSHKAIAGPAKKYMVIKNYFKEVEKSPFAQFYIVASNIKLSKKRLFSDPDKALIKDPTKRGLPISLPKWKLMGEQEKRTGSQIFADFNAGSESSVMILTILYAMKLIK